VTGKAAVPVPHDALDSPRRHARRTLRSQQCAAALALTAALVFPYEAAAQQSSYPARPIRIIVGFTPASSNDILARFVAARLAERLGQQVVVDNRPGANGAIGSDLAAKATPDGHTLMLMSTSHTMNAAVNAKLPFDPVKSFVPIAMIGAGPLVLVTHPSFSAGSVKTLIELAKAKPGALTYASAGTGGINHFAGVPHRQHQQGPPGRRPRPRHRIQHLRLPGVRHRSR